MILWLLEIMVFGNYDSLELWFLGFMVFNYYSSYGLWFFGIIVIRDYGSRDFWYYNFSFFIDNKQLPNMSIVVLQLGSTEASRIRSNKPSSGDSSFLKVQILFSFC